MRLLVERECAGIEDSKEENLRIVLSYALMVVLCCQVHDVWLPLNNADSGSPQKSANAKGFHKRSATSRTLYV